MEPVPRSPSSSSESDPTWKWRSPTAQVARAARAAQAAQAAQGRSAGRRTGSRIRHHPYVRPSSAGRRTGRQRGAILARSDDEDEVDGPAKNKATSKNEEKVKEEAEIQKKGGQMQKEGDKIQEEGDEIQKVSP
jgi:hypothetical protein